MWRTGLDALGVVLITVLVAGSLDLLPAAWFTDSMQVVDGDSLRPADGSRDIRLQGIDAPELAQNCRDTNGHSYNCGRKAKAHLKAVIAGREIKCRTLNVDRYDRSLSICSVGETELNRQMISDGWAVAYINHSAEYARLEATAKAARKGIWQGDFDRPEEWRRLNPATTVGNSFEPD
jgi:endonuclease YncB( thermonuclease family)